MGHFDRTFRIWLLLPVKKCRSHCYELLARPLWSFRCSRDRIYLEAALPEASQSIRRIEYLPNLCCDLAHIECRCQSIVFHMILKVREPRPTIIHEIVDSCNLLDMMKQSTLCHAVYCPCLFHWKPVVCVKRDGRALIITAAVYYMARFSFFSGLWKFSLRFLILKFDKIVDNYVGCIPKLSCHLLEAFIHQFPKCRFFITNVKSIVTESLESLQWAPAIGLASDVTN